MELVKIYDCLRDRTRLRILHVLAEGPLCVCHFQSILREPQVKISKHLAYLRRNGLVESERCGNWMIYRLPRRIPSVLRANLKCLRDDPRLKGDRARLAKARAGWGPDCPVCVRQPRVSCAK